MLVPSLASALRAASISGRRCKASVNASARSELHQLAERLRRFGEFQCHPAPLRILIGAQRPKPQTPNPYPKKRKNQPRRRSEKKRHQRKIKNSYFLECFPGLLNERAENQFEELFHVVAREALLGSIETESLHRRQSADGPHGLPPPSLNSSEKMSFPSRSVWEPWRPRLSSPRFLPENSGKVSEACCRGEEAVQLLDDSSSSGHPSTAYKSSFLRKLIVVESHSVEFGVGERLRSSS